MIFQANKVKRKWVKSYQTKQTSSQKKVTRDKDQHYIINKGPIHKKDVTVINIYSLNIGVPKYTNELLIDQKGKVNSKTIRVGNFNIPLTSMNRSSRQKVNKETVALNETLDQDGLN